MTTIPEEIRRIIKPLSFELQEKVLREALATVPTELDRSTYAYCEQHHGEYSAEELWERILDDVGISAMCNRLVRLEKLGLIARTRKLRRRQLWRTLR